MAKRKRKTSGRSTASRRKNRTQDRMPAGLITLFAGLVLMALAFVPGSSVYQIMANELKIPHVIVSLAYMTIQTFIIVGYIYYQRYGYIFLIGCILLLSAIYVLFMKKYFSRHIS